MSDNKPDQHLVNIGLVGPAAASLATGPTLVLLLAIYVLCTRSSNFLHLDGLIAMMGYSVLFCLIASAAMLNALVLDQLARRAADHAIVAAISGALIGLLVTMVFAHMAPRGNIDGEVGLLFSATGLLMGLLHWVIEIRPRRLRRLSRARDTQAVRAAE